MSRVAAPRQDSLLAATLREPDEVRSFDLKRWERLIGEARGADLLGQLHERLDAAGRLDSAPPEARRHLDIARRLSQRHREAVLWELDHIAAALGPLEVPVVLLKGAAYCMSGRRAALGRTFNDVDILVPSHALGRVEDALMGGGWIPEGLNRYDQRYYRKWMHELPPMQHKDRCTLIDVHHTIVPPTSGIVPDAAALLARAVPAGQRGAGMYAVLAPEDMVIHSACHLFFNEFHKGLRDLYDLHTLFGEFGVDAGFWPRIQVRAMEMGLARPLLDAMEQSRRVYGTAVPEEARLGLRAALGTPVLAGPRRWMLERVLLPDHPSCASRATRFARWLAFVRSHWLRMPLPLLVYHLAHKALRSE